MFLKSFDFIAPRLVSAVKLRQKQGLLNLGVASRNYLQRSKNTFFTHLF